MRFFFRLFCRFSALSLVVAAVVAVGAGCQGAAGDSSPPTAGDSPADEGTAANRAGSLEQVRLATVEPGSVDAMLTASGSVTAPRTTDLGVEVSGRIERVFVDVGDSLEKGQVAFRIDNEPYEINLLEARAGLELAQAEASQAEQEVKRLERLVEQAVAPEQALEQERTRHQVAMARVAQQNAATLRAESDLARTTVKAPYDGYVVARHLHEGAWVGPGPASIVVTLQQRRGFEANVNVPESAAVPVAVGDPTELLIEGIQERIETTVLAVNARIDAESRTYRVRIPIPEGVGAVKAGAFVRAEIRPARRIDGLVVDRTALLLRDGRTYAFRLKEDGSKLWVEQVAIRVGARGTGLIEVLDGLESGDLVVVGSVTDRLADGTPVQLEAGTELPS